MNGRPLRAENHNTENRWRMFLPRAVSNPVSLVTENVTPALVILLLKQPLYEQRKWKHKSHFFWQWRTRDSYTYILYNIDDSSRRREKCSVQSTMAVCRKFLLTPFRPASYDIRVCRFSKCVLFSVFFPCQICGFLHCSRSFESSEMLHYAEVSKAARVVILSVTQAKNVSSCTTFDTRVTCP